ncbi:SDR family oxidoreductase [Actinomadura barringtoniae]|uniref:SDR family oxidoreductase n=1 Tax=Actinomadura barringtoniae TaxID=1427535 RepID=A0A939PCT8_9ACTN|nr:SDR family oxidoreductase [Actinomadura barringtoniae]MBO2447693.1 SDR family oxidoreductase [Actinomadura barringtoniae]
MGEQDTDRVALISGGGTGIGQAIAARFGALGWRVAVGGRRTDLLERTAELVTKAGGTPFTHPLDVTSADSVEAFFAAAQERLGPVSVVINNAAVAFSGPLCDADPGEIDLAIATKLTGSLYMARQGVLAMRRAGSGGDILFITSTSAVEPWPHHLAYAAASAGVEQAARTLRLELDGTGIRVTTLRCSNTKDTEFVTRELGSDKMMDANRAWFRHALVRHAGLMTPDQVAEAVAQAVTLPPSLQYEVLAPSPMAPTGPLPGTFDEFIGEMVRHHMPSA